MTITRRETSPIMDTLMLLHLFNGVSSGIGAAVGYTITAWHHSLPFDYGVMLLAALATIFISSSGFIINDILDIHIDRINRPDRPLPAGRVSLRAAWLLCLGTALAGILCASIINPLTGLLAACIVLALFAYSRVFKKRFLIGHLLIAALGAALLPFGALAAGHLLPVAYSALFVFPAFFAREVLKTVPDYEGDRAAGVDNIATRHGPRVALRVAQAALLVVALVLPLVPLIWPLNTAWLLLVLLIIWPTTFYTLRRARPENARQVMQLSKLLFLLTTLALLIGSIPGL